VTRDRGSGAPSAPKNAAVGGRLHKRGCHHILSYSIGVLRRAVFRRSSVIADDLFAWVRSKTVRRSKPLSGFGVASIWVRSKVMLLMGWHLVGSFLRFSLFLSVTRQCFALRTSGCASPGRGSGWHLSPHGLEGRATSGPTPRPQRLSPSKRAKQAKQAKRAKRDLGGRFCKLHIPSDIPALLFNFACVFGSLVSNFQFQISGSGLPSHGTIAR